MTILMPLNLKHWSYKLKKPLSLDGKDIESIVMCSTITESNRRDCFWVEHQRKIHVRKSIT